MKTKLTPSEKQMASEILAEYRVAQRDLDMMTPIQKLRGGFRLTDAERAQIVPSDTSRPE